MKDLKKYNVKYIYADRQSDAEKGLMTDGSIAVNSENEEEAYWSANDVLVDKHYYFYIEQVEEEIDEE